MRLVYAVVVVACACGGGRKGGGGGDGGPGACSPEGANQCSGASWQTCQGGQWVTAVDCPMACADGIGCVQCQPGTQYCMGGDVWGCDQNGTPSGVVQQCTGANTCVNGTCTDACADAAQNRSYIGCEYWAVDLDNAVEVLGQSFEPALSCAAAYGLPTGAGQTETLNVCFASNQCGTPGKPPCYEGLCDANDPCPSNYTCTSKAVCVLDAQHASFAIIVSNPQARDAHVTVTGANGATITQTIAAGQVAPILPQMGGTIPDQSVGGTIHAKLAYKITSDMPIVAYQFNPLDNTALDFSNDASLLIPQTAFDIDYYGLAWPTLDRRNPAPGPHPYYGYLTVVAATDNTQISVTPTTAVQASATQQTIAAGATVNFTLNAFDVLQLEASGAGDLTGTSITSTNMVPFGLFGGHQATAFGETTPPDAQHTLGPCCADHLEEMVFPKSTWGKAFAIARSQPRTNEPDYLRIMAQKPGTAVTFTPAPTTVVSGDCTNLAPGGFCDVKIQGDTEISSTEPVLVGHYLESSIWQNTARTSSVGTGDPSMAIAVPTEQYRTDYTILIPNAYSQGNYLSISAAPTGAVTVDGTSVTLAPFPGGGTHRVARVPVTAGQHTIHCPDGCGVLVYGYDSAVSYMFAGGLDLKQIVIQ
ncbi:MAG: IgGFc-binding protein [Acidobacteriota bacterium]